MRRSPLTQSSFSAEVVPPDFNLPTTRIKIRPDTVIAFDDTDHVILSHPFTPKGHAVRVQSDILLILWDLVHWKTMGELLGVWPDPVDHPKIVGYIEQFYHMQMILVEGHRDVSSASLPFMDHSSLYELEPLQPQSSGFSGHFNLNNHWVMLQDDARVLAYKQAIERTIKADSVALDLGCGSGVLGFLAHQAGAKHVVGIERREDMTSLASLIAQYNGLERMTFIAGDSTRIALEQLPAQPNVLIAELLGDGGLDEQVLESMLDARDRLLAKDATLIPYKLTLSVFGFEADNLPDCDVDAERLSAIYGVDLMPFAEVLKRKPQRVKHTRFDPDKQHCLTDAIEAVALDLYTLESPVVDVTLDLPVAHDGTLGGFGVYFNAWLDDDITLTNNPWEAPTHWEHMMFVLNSPKPVQAGEGLPVRLTYDGQLNVRLADEI